MAAPQSNQINYPNTIFNISNNYGNSLLLSSSGLEIKNQNEISTFITTINVSSLSSNMSSFDVSFNALTLCGASSNSSGQVITSDSNGKPRWADIPTSFINFSITNYATINNLSTDILYGNNTSVTNLSISNSLTINNTLNVSEQATFNTPPHIPDPRFGNDAASKGYVDSLVGQYSGGYNLFFNYSETVDANYKSLSQTLINTTEQKIDTTFSTSGDLLIAKFITSTIGITEIPIGIWDTLIYGAVDKTNDTIYYFFKLSKMILNGTVIPLYTSGYSSDINATPNNMPTAYNIKLPITTPESFLITDKIIIELWANRTGHGHNIMLTTYFQHNYYSFTQTTLNAGTTLLSSNNTWTGTNNYSIGITTPTVDTTGALTIGTTNATSTTIGRTTNNLTLRGSTIELNGDIRNIDGVNPTLTDKSLTLKNYVISVAVIPGTIITWPSATGPPNNQYNSATIKAYLYCDGATYSKALYPELSNAIALDFPDASPLINFKVPDLRSRFVVGAQSAGVRQYLGTESGGQISVTLNQSHIPQHNHSIGATTRRVQGVSSGGTFVLNSLGESGAGTELGSTGNYGNAPPTAVSTVPPYIALFYFIKT
jgi:microcystin-dependent protein